MSEYKKLAPSLFRCDYLTGGCGRPFIGRATIHEKTSVAGVKCPLCDHVHEPWRITPKEMIEMVEDQAYLERRYDR